MSAGQNLRRGYAYGVSSAVHSGGTLERRSGSPDMVSLVMLATVVLIIAAVIADPVLSASIGHILGTAWSDAIAFLTRLVSRAG